MQRTFLKMVAIALLMASAAYGQSLGEIARENREKQSAQETSGTPPRVITNQDLGEGPEGKPEARLEQPANSRAMSYGQRSDQRSDQQRQQEQHASEQWRRQILAQESRVANIQARIDQINASLRSEGASAQGPYTRYQAHQLERAEQMQLQLDEQKRTLYEMQESARRAGMHTTVYDP
jgi:hypothetical protein